VRRRAILAVVVVSLALAGCGGSSGADPSAYVKSVCTALTTWRDTVQAAGQTLQAATAQSHLSLNQGKQSYLMFVAALLRATTTAGSTLKGAGTPAVNGGKQVSTALVNAFGGAQKGLAHAASQATLIPTTNAPAYAVAAANVTNGIRDALSSMTAVSPREDPALRAAANKEPACSALKAAGG
jgi:predicted small secreted protein